MLERYGCNVSGRLRGRCKMVSLDEVMQTDRHRQDECHVSDALVQLQPDLLDRVIERGAVFRRHSLVAEQKRAIDQLNVEASIPDSLECL